MGKWSEYYVHVRKVWFMKGLRFLSAMIATIWLPIAATSGEETHEGALSDNYCVRDADTAGRVARDFAGLSKCPGPEASGASEVSLRVAGQDSTNSFLHRNIDGKTVWSVIFRDVALGTGAGSSKRDFEIYVDPASGRFLKAILPADIDDMGIGVDFWEEVPPIPDSTFSVCLTLPPNPPEVALPQAIQVALKGRDPDNREIEAFYLSYEWVGRGERVVWLSDVPLVVWCVVIKDVYNETVVDSLGRSVELRQPRTEWCFVDARTGSLQRCYTTTRMSRSPKR